MQLDIIKMPKIHSIKEPFDLAHLRMSNPINKNGSHFIKTLAAEDPLYFLAPKCFVKQGFVSHGKKIFCDFVFSNEDSEFLTWLENLEETVRSTIYTNREKWFETPLDEHDIESSMSSAYKFYKSGKFFIIRANVPTALGKINIKIYDENEEETESEHIKENTNVLAVFEFQGIKCGVRSFQFEIELKQLLVVQPEKLFDSCIIRKSTNPTPDVIQPRPLIPTAPEPILHDSSSSSANANGLPAVESILPTDGPSETIVNVSEDLAPPEPNSITDGPSNPSVVEILEVDFPLEESADAGSEEPIKLKDRSDVYYKLYKEAREKARAAKRESLANYLEAKRIKTTYLLKDVSDSDSDLEDLDS
jgi:hypothetical protein